jgi:hypothetical protein
MKNIHIFPTDKPSRLVIDTIENKLYLQPILHEKTINVLTQNIYITNDEKIKEGDWCLDKFNQRWKLEDEILIAFDNKGIKRFSTDNILGHECKKIILTDNSDLIKDGVQPIDDEFLEWFVKNPSCESAMVEEKYRKCCRNTDGKNENCIEPINCEGWLSKEYERPYKTTCDKRFEGYKIIIPQQEQDKKMYSEVDLEVAYFEGREGLYSFNYWIKQFKNK